MIQSYLKLLLRNFYKKKLYSLINITGLAIGIASFLLIMLYVLDEYSYDRYHKEADRIHRICMIYDFGGVGENSASQPFPVAWTLKNEYPDLIENTVRIFNFQSKRNLVEYDDMKFNEERIFFADSSFFEMFTHHFLQGDPQTALDEPNSIVITKSTAFRYFGDEDPMGKRLEFEDRLPLTVTGLIEDVPANSHFIFDMMASMGSVRQIYRGGLPRTWVWNPCWTYLLLAENVSPEQLEDRYPEFIDKYFLDAEKESITLYTQPLKNIHLDSRLDYEIEANGNRTYTIILSIIGCFILIIAAINFMNLATATSSTRAREIGIRKVTGAYRSQLVWQFTLESWFMALLAVVIGIILVEIALPYFNDHTGKSITLSNLFSFPNLFYLIFLWMVVGTMSGLYPALFLSSFKPISVLRGTARSDISSGTARKILVVFQFVISIGLIIATLTIYQQLGHLRKASLGFNNENVLLVPINRTNVATDYISFKNELLTHSNILAVTALDDVIGASHNTHEFRPEGVPEDEWRFYPALVVRHDFVKLFEIEILAGRDYQEEAKTDPLTGMLISESMVKHLGWNMDDAIGKKFSSLQGEERVIGIFSDFHATSLHEPAGPFVLNMKEVPSMINFFMNYVAIRIGDGELKPTLLFLKEKWLSFEPLRPFEYTFLEDELATLYRDEENLGSLSLMLTILILFVAGLGLFGLASFMAERRTKEISIRKVLGASVWNIFILLSKEFARLLMIAMLIAWPLAYFAIDAWFLDQFIYRTDINLWIFLVSGLSSMLLALSITSYRAFTASRTNPAETLKYE